MKKCGPMAVVLLMALSLLFPPSSRADDVVVSALPTVIGNVQIDSGASGIAIDESRNLIYVTSFYANRIWRIDGGTSVPTNFSAFASKPIGIAVDTTNQRLIVANNDQSLASIINANDGSLITAPGVGTSSWGAAYDPVSGKAYVASYDGNILYRINPDNSVAGIALTGQPVWIAIDPTLGRAYVTLRNRQAVAVINTATDERLPDFVGYYGSVAGIAVNPNTHDIYVVNEAEGAVTVVDQSGNPKSVLDVGGSGGDIQNIAINPGTNHAFVTRFDTDQVYVYDITNLPAFPSALAPLTILTVGDGPGFGIAVNQTTGRVYVGNYNTNTVTMINDALPTIKLSASSVSFLGSADWVSPSQSLVISNPGGGSLDWTVATAYGPGASNWLTVGPTSGNVSGSTPATITLDVDTSPNSTPLGDGVYTATLTFSSVAASSSKTVTVQLSISHSIKRVYLPAALKNSSSGGW